jgi:Uma2 family endonuclease
VHRPPLWIYTARGSRRILIENAMQADPVLRRAETPVPREDLIRRWKALADDPTSPDYYELTQFGELIVSPRPTTGHQAVASEVAFQLRNQLGPRAATEVGVLTDRGVRVPDVVWMPSELWAACKGQSPLEVVPDVCVEVLSPGNTREEIDMKITAYLRGGAREVIVVGVAGEVEIYGPQGRRETSALGISLALPSELF